MSRNRVVVVGGGLAGMAVALRLADGGWRDITVLEAGPALGGLAGSFEHNGRWYPLGYHHILSKDHTLLSYLARIGALDRVQWRRIRMLFEAESGLYDLGHPRDLLRFPLPMGSKLRFLRLMGRAFLTRDWSPWSQESAAVLLERWGDPVVRRVLFEPLAQLKFRLSCEEISAEWLGTRLSYREGAAPLGYIPETNWTKVLCDGMEGLIRSGGATVHTRAAVEGMRMSGTSVTHVLLEDGRAIDGDHFVSTIPTSAYVRICPGDRTPHLASIRYTSLLSMVCTTTQPISPDFYWLNLATRRHSACGLFNLSALNPTIGSPGEACLNFVTHLRGNADETFGRTDGEIVDAYLEDFQRLFGMALSPCWTKLSRIPIYSPVFVKGYTAPPVRSTTARNVYFAGNHCGAPSIASTGSALASGVAAAESLLRDHGVH
jgi:protoporphyrinogen oxidase